MNKFIAIIITNAVALITGALKFIPNLTADLYNSAIDEIVTQLQASKAEFTAEATEATPEVIEGMTINALEIVQAGLDSKGDTKYDKWIEEGISFLEKIEAGAGTLLAGIKTWFQATFQKKKLAATEVPATPAQ